MRFPPHSCLPDFLSSPGLPALRELSCDNNMLTQVPDVLASEYMSDLAHLSLSNNSISAVPP